ncbi:hypothetical protein LTR85_010907 [Meristemomyces frigidus]|nr:hypothetical protein LTR85_010907 [Meristemomyces frigidus]
MAGSDEVSETHSDTHSDDSSAVVGLDFDEVVERMHAWVPGDVEELKELGIIVQGLFNGRETDDANGLETVCLALLAHEQLPPFYRAKMHAYLSACENQHTNDQVILASSWILEARGRQMQLGWMPEEIVQWKHIIRREKDKAFAKWKAEKAAWRAARDATGPSLGMMGGADDDVTDDIAPEPVLKETPAEKAEAKKAQQHAIIERGMAKQADEERLRHQAAKLPKSLGTEESTASGSGTRGVVQRLRQKLSQVFRAYGEDEEEEGDA